MTDYVIVEVEIDETLYLKAKERADAIGLSVQDYVEQALEFAMQAEDLPDEPAAPVATEEEE